jgi:uncharacterized protein (TIGR03437 family)
MGYISALEDRLRRLKSLLLQPLPTIYGSDWQKVVQNLVASMTPYEELYWTAYQKSELARFQLGSADRFFRAGDYANAERYADFAFNSHDLATKLFSQAIDAYNNKLSKIETAFRAIQSAAYQSLCVGLEVTSGTVGKVACEIATSAIEYGVDRATLGGDQATRDLLLKLAVKAFLENPTYGFSTASEMLAQSPNVFALVARITSDPQFQQYFLKLTAGVVTEQVSRAFLKALQDTDSRPSVQPQSSVGEQQIHNTTLTVPLDYESVKNPKGTSSESVFWPEINSTGVVNAASYLGGGVSPGEIVAVFGEDIGPEQLVPLTIAEDGAIAKSLAGVRLLFDGVPAPLLYVSKTQIGAVVPYAVASRDSTEVQVEYLGVKSVPVEVSVVPANPGIFSLDMSGRGRGAILNQDGSVNSEANPSDKGSVVSIYATGEGQTDPWGVDGQIAADRPPKPLLPVSLTIGGVPTEILYVGGAPTLVAGVLQINVRVPSNAPSGPSIPVVLTIGEASSQEQITMAIR